MLNALVKRWHVRQRMTPELELADHAVSYCQIFSRDSLQARRPWLLELPINGTTQPAHWPRNLDWGKHRRYWQDTLRRVIDWQHGEFDDPCPAATDWGNVAIGDHPKPNMRLLGCGGQGRLFANQFYVVTRKAAL